MKEQIEAIAKQVEKIKEIAFTNKEHLEFAHEDLTPWEIEKIRESQKITADIVSFNIIAEYKKLKRRNMYIRLGYLFTLILIVWFSWLITTDYISVKIQNEDVKNIQKKKETLEKQKWEFEKQNKELKKTLEENMDKNNTLSSLLKQKDNQIEILKKSINEQIALNKNPKNVLSENISSSWKINTPTLASSLPNITLSWWIISNSWTLNSSGKENIKCISNTTITINVRDIPGVDGKVLSFLNEWTQVEVLTKQTKNDRVWYEIQTSNITGWISSVWIEEFDNTCLK